MAELVVRGARVHYQGLGQKLGQGESPVVFLHGLVMDNLSSWYFTLANPLATRRGVLLYDLRGHGKSERTPGGYRVPELVADLAALLDALGHPEGPVDLVGNSFGGLLALAFAMAHPERAGRIVLVDAQLCDEEWVAGMGRTLGLEGAERDRQIAESFRHWLGRHSDRKRNRLATNARELVYGTSLVADLAASPTFDDRELARLGSPVLALYGEQSDVRSSGEKLARLAPRCELEIFPGCSHSILWEATDRLRARVLGWLAPVRAQGSPGAGGAGG